MRKIEHGQYLSEKARNSRDLSGRIRGKIFICAGRAPSGPKERRDGSAHIEKAFWGCEAL